MRLFLAVLLASFASVAAPPRKQAVNMTAKPLTNGQHPGVLTALEHGVSKANMACGPARGRSSP